MGPPFLGMYLCSQDGSNGSFSPVVHEDIVLSKTYNIMIQNINILISPQQIARQISSDV